MLGTLLKWFGGEGSKPASNKSESSAPEIGEPSGAPEIRVPLVKLNKLYEGDRGIFDLADNEAVLRLWLPVPLKTAMNESMAEMEVTAAKYLREFFVVYLYGAHELLRMKAEKTGLYYEPPPRPDSGIRYSRTKTIDCIPGLGKNIVATKIYIPQKIKADFELLANRVGVPLSRYMRELLVSHFLGHTVWPERITGWIQEEECLATDWENGIVEAENFVYSSDKSLEEITGDAAYSEVEIIFS